MTTGAVTDPAISGFAICSVFSSADAGQTHVHLSRGARRSSGGGLSQTGVPPVHTGQSHEPHAYKSK